MSPTRVTLLSLALAGLVSISVTATSPANLMKKDDSSTDLAPGFKWSFYNVAALTTAVVVVSAGFAAIMTLFLPLFTYKLCYIMGSCPESLSTYVDNFVATDPKSRKVNKRSIDYLEPMLTTLANAYEKYADSDLKKKFNKRTY